MKKYFRNVSSFEDLKSQYKALLKANHPDNGGDPLEVIDRALLFLIKSFSSFFNSVSLFLHSSDAKPS
ncbi:MULTISPECIES: hypothetical protein [unclassified Lactonifactor]|uniref:hypothetical protein n=1 Tax=unclassified Lactonifactor TaxID=2636670 RepID=UPI001FA97A69|nr:MULTISPECIES: hypothetical protein [unclassified Lactonifactor]